MSHNLEMFESLMHDIYVKRVNLVRSKLAMEETRAQSRCVSVRYDNLSIHKLMEDSILSLEKLAIEYEKVLLKDYNKYAKFLIENKK